MAGYHGNHNAFDIFFPSQVIAVSKSSDIVLMVLDASKVSFYVNYAVFLLSLPPDEWI